MENRKRNSKYIIGNVLFLLMAFFLGAIFYAYVFDSVSSSINNSKSIFPNFVSILALSLVLFGTLITLYKRFSISTSFAEFVYLFLIFLIASYFFKFLTLMDDSFSYPIMFLATLFSSYVLMIMMSLWRRKSGLSIISLFTVGFIASSLLFGFYNSDLTHFYLLRTSIFCAFIFVLFYIFGFFGIVKNKKHFLIFSSLIVLGLSFYPFKLDESIHSLNRYRWINNFVDESKIEYLNTEKSKTGEFDYFFYRDALKYEYLTAFNSNMLPFSYPFDYEQEKFLLINCLQSNALSNVLIIGQAPFSIFEFLNFRFKIDRKNIHFKLYNEDYLKYGSKIVSLDIKEFAELREPDATLFYDLVLVFPQADTTGSIVKKYSSQIENLKNYKNSNILIFNNNGLGNFFINELGNNYSSLFLLTDEKLDFSFNILTNDAKSVGVDADSLKRKYIVLSNDENYLYFQSTLESNNLTFNEKNINNFMNKKFSFKAFLSMVFSILFIFLFFIYHKGVKKKGFKNIWNYFYLLICPFLFFYVLNSFFYNSINFYKYHSILISLFFLGILLGVFINLKLNTSLKFSNFSRIVFVFLVLLLVNLSFILNYSSLYYLASFMAGFNVITIEKDYFVGSFILEYVPVLIGLGLIIGLVLFTLVGYILFSFVVCVVSLLYFFQVLSLRENK